MHKRCQSKITIEESWYITCYASKYRRQHRKVKKYKKKKCNETSFFYGWGPFCQQKCSFTDQEHSAAVHLLGRLLVFSLGIVSQSQRLKTPLFPCPNPLNCTWWFSFTVSDFDQMSHLKNNFCYKTRQRRIFPKLPSQGLYMNKQCNNIFLVLVWKTTSVSFVTTFDIRILYQKGKDAI